MDQPNPPTTVLEKSPSEVPPQAPPQERKLPENLEFSPKENNIKITIEWTNEKGEPQTQNLSCLGYLLISEVVLNKKDTNTKLVAFSPFTNYQGRSDVIDVMERFKLQILSKTLVAS